MEKVRELPFDEKWEIYAALGKDLEDKESDWHEEELKRRRELAAQGLDPLMDWEEAKKILNAESA